MPDSALRRRNAEVTVAALAGLLGVACAGARARRFAAAAVAVP
jgi:hypothetical protein